MAGGGSFIILVVLMGGMLFFMSRTQKKQQKKRQETLDSMQVGNKVVTIGGLHGVISRVNADENTVEIDCEGVYLTFNRSAIASVQPSDEQATVSVETVTTDDGTEATVTTASEVADSAAISDENTDR